MSKRTIDNPLDDLTLELERAEALTDHLAAQLFELIREHRECYALSLIAEQIREKHKRIRANALALVGAR